MCISVMDIIYRDEIQTGFGRYHKLFRYYYQKCVCIIMKMNLSDSNISNSIFSIDYIFTRSCTTQKYLKYILLYILMHHWILEQSWL